jgi:hypothetical protein
VIAVDVAPERPVTDTQQLGRLILRQPAVLLAHVRLFKSHLSCLL